MHNLNDEHDDLDLIQAVAKQLHIKTSKELHDLREVLFPSILCAMVHAGAGKFLIFEDYFSKNLNVKNKYLKKNVLQLQPNWKFYESNMELIWLWQIMMAELLYMLLHLKVGLNFCKSKNSKNIISRK